MEVPFIDSYIGEIHFSGNLGETNATWFSNFSNFAKNMFTPQKTVNIPVSLWKKKCTDHYSIFTSLRKCEFQVIINPDHVTGLFLYHLKTLENLWFSDVFGGYRKRPMAGFSVYNQVLLVLNLKKHLLCTNMEQHDDEKMKNITTLLFLKKLLYLFVMHKNVSIPFSCKLIETLLLTLLLKVYRVLHPIHTNLHALFNRYLLIFWGFQCNLLLIQSHLKPRLDH